MIPSRVKTIIGSISCLLLAMIGMAGSSEAQSIGVASEARGVHIARLASECQQGSLGACREILPTVVGGRALQRRVLDDDTEAPLPVPELVASPDVRALAMSLVRVVRLSAASGTTPITTVRALGDEFPADPVLADSVREQLFARGDDAWLRARLCRALAAIDPSAALRRHPTETRRPDFVHNLVPCLRAAPIASARPRWASVVEALGAEASLPVIEAWVDAEIAELPRASSPEQIIAALRTLPPAATARLAEATVAHLRTRPASEQAMIGSLAQAFPEQESLARFQGELAAEAQRRAASDAEDRAREAAEAQQRAASDAALRAREAAEAQQRAASDAADRAREAAEDRRRAASDAAARQAEEQRQRAAATARECVTRCQSNSDACATAHPEQLFNRCLREFEQCQVRCQR